MKIEAPKKDHFSERMWLAADFAATAADAAVASGAASSLVKLLHYMVGDSNQIREEKWRELLSKAVNDLKNRVSAIEQAEPQIFISSLATLVATYCVKEATPELSDPIARDQLTDAFSAISPSDIDMAVAELSDLGLVNKSRCLGASFRAITLNSSLFSYLDPVVHQWVPQADAVAICNFFINNPDLQVTSKLEAAIEWPRRRMNSALLYLRDAIFETGHYSNDVIHDYPSRWFKPAAEEFSRINRLARELSANGISIPEIPTKQ